MKKFLATLLALALVCTLGVSALAKNKATIDIGDLGYTLGGDSGGDINLIENVPLFVDTDWSQPIHDGDVVYPDKTGYLPLVFVPQVAGNYKHLMPLQMLEDLGDKAYIRPVGNLLTDKKLTSVKLHKEDGSKLLKSVEIVQKDFDSLYYPESEDSDNLLELAFHHVPALKFVFNDFLTDDEQKVSGYVDIKIKKNAAYLYDLGKYVTFDSAEDLKRLVDQYCGEDEWDDWVSDAYDEVLAAIESGDTQDIIDEAVGSNIIPKDTVIRIPFEFFLNNRVVTTGDETMTAGTGGYIVKPEKNEDGAYEWEDENRTLATLDFGADSDPGKLYSKLSTRWSDLGDGFYAEHFPDRDAFLLNFVAGPSAPAAAYNAKLSLRFPFVDEDGEPTVEEGEWTVYEVVDGEPQDVTAKWTLAETDDGDWALTSKTRKLGTYIIAGPQGAAGAAEGEAAPVATGITLSAYAR